VLQFVDESLAAQIVSNNLSIPAETMVYFSGPKQASTAKEVIFRHNALYLNLFVVGTPNVGSGPERRSGTSVVTSFDHL
jgi:hypothetical protein